MEPRPTYRPIAVVAADAKDDGALLLHRVVAVGTHAVIPAKKWIHSIYSVTSVRGRLGVGGRLRVSTMRLQRVELGLRLGFELAPCVFSEYSVGGRIKVRVSTVFFSRGLLHGGRLFANTVITAKRT